VRKKTPDWAFPKRPLALARWLLMSLCGIGILRQIAYVREVSRRSPAPESEPAARDASRGLARFAFIALVLAALTWTGAWLPFLLFWVVPFLTWTQLVLHLRSIAEHFAIARPAGTGIFAQTRNTIAGRLDRLFVASKHVGLHLDHHLYPSVPFHRLPELHALLLRDDRYRSSAHHSAGYWQVLRECLQSDPARAEEGSAR
jgi:fatty acid desaturase